METILILTTYLPTSNPAKHQTNFQQNSKSPDWAMILQTQWILLNNPPARIRLEDYLTIFTSPSANICLLVNPFTNTSSLNKVLEVPKFEKFLARRKVILVTWLLAKYYSYYQANNLKLFGIFKEKSLTIRFFSNDSNACLVLLFTSYTGQPILGIIQEDFKSTRTLLIFSPNKLNA